jgi:uncharacterized protein YvpB
MQLVILMFAIVVAGVASLGAAPQDSFSHLIAFKNFSKFQKTKGTNVSETVLTSPVLEVPLNWNELVVSWNADAPPGTHLKIEARGIYSNRTTKFYNLGIWSADNSSIERQSMRGQKDDDGTVSTDTLILNEAGAKAELRLTLTASSQGAQPRLKFLGLSFCDTSAEPVAREPFKPAWGKELDVIDRSQNAYPDEKGWCSPTSVSMVLDYWSKKLKRSELALDVPELVPVIYDKGWGGTGNWPFNTAFVGSFKKMRAYVTRLSDISELERWTAAGFPVVISSPWHLLQDGRKSTGSGHIVVCTGFTPEGDVVINDPGTDPKGPARREYKRGNVIKAWKKSNNTVYLIYPENAKIPKDELEHWEK